MKRTFRTNLARSGRTARVILPLFATMLCASTAWAQPPGGGPGGPPPGGGFGGPGFGGPGGPPPGMGMPRASMTADIPMPMLEAGLNLTADQKAQIAPIQRAFRSQRPGGMGGNGGFPPPPGGGNPPPPGPPNGGPPNGGPPDPAMRGQLDAMRNAQQQASKQIEAILTPEQKQALPALLKELDALRGVGIPADLYGQLKLTSDQKTRIAGIAQKSQQKMRANMDTARQSGDFQTAQSQSQQIRRQAHDDALALLTPTQQQLVQRQPRNRPPGGPNGGPPPGGPNGGPPPPNGGDGPPPPGGGDGPPPVL